MSTQTALCTVKTNYGSKTREKGTEIIGEREICYMTRPAHAGV
jgi:hypothetical protein